MTSKLFYNIDSTIVHDYHEDVAYGDWSTDYSFDSINLFAKDHGGRLGTYTNSIDVDFDVWPGQILFPVIVTYSSGDTFGSSSGQTTLVAVFNDADKAYRLADVIQKGYDKGEGYKLYFEGQEIYTYEWTGYFESLQNVQVLTEMVKA